MNGKIYVVTSAAQGNGAKYLATNLAFEMQKRLKTQKVLLIDFDFENPILAYEYVKHDEVHGIDNLINSISGEGLTDDLFKENVIHTPIEVDVLRGTLFPDQQKTFNKDVIETILDYAKKMYDYIFVVVGNKANSAGTVYSLLSADTLFIVLKNNNTNMFRIERVLKGLLQYYKNSKDIMMVYNFKNHNAKSEMNTKLSGMKAQVCAVLEYDEKTIDNVNLEKRMSAFGAKCLNNKSYLKIIDMLLA